MLRTALTLLGILLSALGPDFCEAAEPRPVSAQGVIDLRSWDFQSQGPVNLNGEYEFYWSAHFTPGRDVLSASVAPLYMQVPSTWAGVKLNGELLEGQGYATYRLNVLVGESRNLALRVPDIGTAYRLLIDGRQAFQVGVPGTTKESTTPGYYPKIVDIPPGRARIELVFHVSNFHYREGGIWLPVRLGDADQIKQEVEMQRALDLMLFGAILIIGFYNLALFFLRREDKSPLYLGVFCLLLAVRLLSVGDRFLTRVLPDLSFDAYVRIEYLSWMLAVSAFAAFVADVLPKEFPRAGAYLVHVLVALGSFFIVVTPVEVFSYVVTPFQVITIVCLVIGTVSFLLAVFRRRDGAVILTVAYAVLFYAVVNDILVNQGLIDSVLLLDIGLLVFIFFQSVLISYRFTRSFNTIEAQRKLLEASNLRLQTQEKLRRKAETESETLQSSRESASRMTTVEGLTDGLSQLGQGTEVFYRGVQDLLLIAAGKGDREPLDLNQRVQHLVGMDDFQQALDDHRTRLAVELSDALPHINACPAHIERLITGLLAYHMHRGASRKRLKLTTSHEVTDERTLFYGAVPNGEYLVLGVEDADGGVFDPQDLGHLFENSSVLADHLEYGDGLTMALVWKVVRDHCGGIDVLSLDGGGTRFEVYLPVAPR